MKKDNRSMCAVKTSIGGQALMEGIMMKGPKSTFMAVRNPQGEIVVEEVPTKASKRPKFCKWPVIRGVFGFIDSMALGYKSLMRSAEISGLEDLVEESPKKKKKDAEEAPVETVEESVEEFKPSAEEEKIPAWMATAMMVVASLLGVGLAIGLFILAPTFLYDLLSRHVAFFQNENPILNSLIKSVFEGVFKIALLVGYMALITLMKDIRRTFMYHGAEHKTIFCYEAGLELTVENIRKQKRFHPRCGTSFLILMLLVSIFVSFFIDPISLAISGSVLHPALRAVVKLLTFPLIMGIGYELIKFAGRHDNLLTRIISAPGVWLQHLTVLEPTDDMIECAIAAVVPVIPNDGSDRW